MAIQLKVVKSFTNSLLNRKEIEIDVSHSNQATPEKAVITRELSTNYSIPETQIYVFGIKTGFGIHRSVAQANMYNSIEDLRKIERPFVVARMTGERKTKVPRRQRKMNRIKSYRMFGTLQRNMRKAARRSKDD